ncbi:homocysteine S-methyltransferase family protein [Nonomuraea sp. NPDC003727]
MILLDGAVATELERRGLPMAAPWWTTRALLTEHGRELLRAVHRRYLEAGARVLTANTFRCNLRALRRAELDERQAGRMVRLAVDLARSARDGHDDVVVAGSMAPVEDCYRPDLVPADAELRAEHRWMAGRLAAAGIGLALIETVNTVREARIAVEEAREAGLTAWVSFVCGPSATLLSGEPVARAAAAVYRAGAAAVLVNCTSLDVARGCVAELAGLGAGDIGVMPNLEPRNGPPVPPERFAALMSGWRRRYGLTLLGGCCGTTPAHITALNGWEDAHDGLAAGPRAVHDRP